MTYWTYSGWLLIGATLYACCWQYYLCIKVQFGENSVKLQVLCTAAAQPTGMFWCVPAVACEDAYLDNSCHSTTSQGCDLSACSPLLWQHADLEYLYFSSWHQAAELLPAYCWQAGERGGGPELRRHSHFFPPGPEGSPSLYKALGAAEEQPHSSMCTRNGANTASLSLTGE